MRRVIGLGGGWEVRWARRWGRRSGGLEGRDLGGEEGW